MNDCAFSWFAGFKSMKLSFKNKLFICYFSLVSHPNSCLHEENKILIQFEHLFACLLCVSFSVRLSNITILWAHFLLNTLTQMMCVHNNLFEWTWTHIAKSTKTICMQKWIGWNQQKRNSWLNKLLFEFVHLIFEKITGFLLCENTKYIPNLLFRILFIPFGVFANNTYCICRGIVCRFVNEHQCAFNSVELWLLSPHEHAIANVFVSVVPECTSTLFYQGVCAWLINAVIGS